MTGNEAGAGGAASAERARAVAASVTDPELPVLTIADLGVLRDVEVTGPGEAAGTGTRAAAAGSSGMGERVVVTLTPTYSGCPALEVMRRDVRARLREEGFADVEIRTALDPPWSSDWISAEGRRKLAASGIAPPGDAPARGPGPVPVTLARRRPVVACPVCGSADTVELSAFGATACKDLWRCRACAEPFEHIKEIA